MKKITTVIVVLLLAGLHQLQAQEIPHLVDRFQLGDHSAEEAHAFQGASSRSGTGLLEQTCRIVSVKAKAAPENAVISFKMKVDQDKLNYFTLKFSGSAEKAFRSDVLVDGMRIGVDYGDEYVPIYDGFGKCLSGRFVYSGVALPLSSTKGKTEVSIQIQNRSNVDADCEIYTAYTHTMPYLELSGEKQGNRPEVKVHPDISEEDKKKHLSMYHVLQNEYFMKMCSDMDKSPDSRMSIHKYSNNLVSYCKLLMTPWNPCKTPDEKRIALNRVFKSIDNWVKAYYQDYRLVLRGGHQGDWGGYFADLGEALYIVEPLILNNSIMGANAFADFLAEPFQMGTEDAEKSISDKDPVTGKTITRKQAWERILKANHDFARSRISYIYNQVYYCYSGAWKAHAGLGVIGSKYYEGRERSHRIFGEMFGFYPFLGEEVLVGPDGEELDLFHSLFRHDRQAQFTDDYVYIVAKGLAKSKLDADGNIVRRLPYGKLYCGLGSGGLTRENGYVFNYGEAANHMPEFFWSTFNNPEDRIINDDLLKAILENLYGRAHTRYTELNNDGYRTMYPTSMLDERGFPWRTKTAYASVPDRMMVFASLAWHMATHPERYQGKGWDKYKNYVDQLCGWVRQYLADNFLFPETTARTKFGKINVDSMRILYLPEAYEFMMNNPDAGKGFVHPFTDFRYYKPEELAAWGVDPGKYRQYGWSDIDALMICLRDDNTQVHAVLCYRNKGYGAIGRVFTIEDKYTHVSLMGMRSRFVYNDVNMRMSGTWHGFVHDFSENFQVQPKATRQELIPICFQPGVGTVERTNFEVDTPFAGYPNYVETLYKDYLLAINTTREEYQNKQSFEVRLPAECKMTKVLDLVSGKELDVVNGAVIIPPMTAYALKLDRTDYDFGAPGPVDVVLPFVDSDDSVTLSWKEAHGASTYNVYRDGVKIADGIAGRNYTDRNTAIGNTYSYQIQAVDKQGGSSWLSHPRQIKVSGSVSSVGIAPDADLLSRRSLWRDDIIGNAAGGHAVVNDTTIAIRNAGGKGFGGGNDMLPESRNLPDSMHYVHRTVKGSVELSGKLYTSASAGVQGLMLRDSLDTKLSRYFFIGCDGNGRLFVQSRSRDTRWDRQFIIISPYRKEIDGLSMKHYPWLRIVRDATTGMTSAWYSADGVKWEKALELFTPLPEVYYAGFAAANGSPSCRFVELKEKTQ